MTVAIAFIVSVPIMLQPIELSAREQESRLFAAQVLALRAAGVAGGRQAVDLIALVPGGRVGETESLMALWRPFFANAIVKLGRLESSRPAALYFNPLLDVALIVLWEKRENGYQPVLVRGLPGERLEEPEAQVMHRAPWMVAEDDPVDTLAQTTATRLDAFASMHPVDAHEEARFATTFATEAADMRSLLPRLLWNAKRRLHWIDGTLAWLRETLMRVKAALGAENAEAVKAAAPDTDVATAAAIARLSDRFVSGLTLDMTLEAGGNQHLLIASLPDDGHIYILALCRLEARSRCQLRRVMLVSLLGQPPAAGLQNGTKSDDSQNQPEPQH